MKHEHMETVLGKSETVPDDTMSIKEIVERYTRGQRIPDNMMRSTINDPNADFDSYDLEEVARQDIADRHELKTELDAKIEEHKTFLKEQKRKQQEAERDRQRSRTASGGESQRSQGRSESDQREGGTTTSKERANLPKNRDDSAQPSD